MKGVNNNTELTPNILLELGFEEVKGDFKKGDFMIYSGHHEFWYWGDVDVMVKTVGDLEKIYEEKTNTKLN